MPLRDAAVGAVAGASLSALGTLALVQRYLNRELRPPRLVHGPATACAEESTDIESNVAADVAERRKVVQELLVRDYWPHPVLEASGYFSTAWAGFMAVLPQPNLPGRMEPVKLADGGTVLLHWALDLPQGSNRIVLVLPGLNNDSRTGFIQATMRGMRDQGFCAVALNYRGVGGVPLTSPRIGCADSFRDLPEVIAHLEATHPGASIFAVGFSMGGGMLLRHVGETGKQCRLRAAVALCAPVDFPLAAKVLESSLKKLTLNFIMTNAVKVLMMSELRKSELTKHLNHRHALMTTRLRALEEATICPLHGYKDAEEYYRESNPMPFLDNIAVPTLMVNAEDDPVISVRSIPEEVIRRNPHIFLALTKRGGHIGWGGGGHGEDPWWNGISARFMQACDRLPGAEAPLSPPRSRL